MRAKSLNGIKAILDKDGDPQGISVTINRKKYIIDEPCDDNGRDINDNRVPSAFKVEKSSFMGREGGDLISFIKLLATHPKAIYKSYEDSDGDQVWKVIFYLKDCPNYVKQIEEAKKAREDKLQRLRAKWDITFVTPDFRIDFFNQLHWNGVIVKDLLKKFGVKHRMRSNNDFLEDLEDCEITAGKIWVLRGNGIIVIFLSKEALDSVSDIMMKWKQESSIKRLISDVQDSLTRIPFDEVCKAIHIANARFQFKTEMVALLAKKYRVDFDMKHVGDTNYMTLSGEITKIRVVYHFDNSEINVQVFPFGNESPSWNKNYLMLDPVQISKDIIEQIPEIEKAMMVEQTLKE